MSLLLPSRSTLTPIALSASRRCKADKSAKGPTTGGKKAGGPPVDYGDSSTETLKKELYDPARPSYTDPSPWQPRRPESAARLAAVLPPANAAEIHGTIARAQRVHQSSSSESRRLALKTKHDLLFAASEELRLVYPGWYTFLTTGGPGQSSTNGQLNLLRPIEGSSRGRVEGLFPVEMRVPTETPGRDGWDYDWTPESGNPNARGPAAA